MDGSGLDRLWAGWRSEYLEEVTGHDEPKPACVFCALLASEAPAEETHIVWRGAKAVAILNAYPYVSGHVLVMPVRHVADLAEVDGEERDALWDGVHTAVAAVTEAYRPDGLNVGMNLGRAAGAGVPGHLHVHVLPRWSGDTNFMTAVAEARVLPEPLTSTLERLQSVWPDG